MTRFNRFNQSAALCALLFCFGLNASADDMQDANKLYKQGQSAQALAKVDALLSAKPRDMQARFLKALILSDQGKNEEAERMLVALTEEYPELPEPYNNLAVMYAGQGKYEKAKTVLEKALRTHPSYSTAHENLGDIYAKMASQAYDRALQLDRNKAVSTTKLAQIKDIYAPAAKSSGNKTQLASLNTTLPAAPAVTPQTSTAQASTAQTAPVTAAVTPPATITIAPLLTSKSEAAVAKAGAPATADSNDEVMKTVNEWAKAWSSRNANKYLSLYAKEFKTPNNESRKSWEQQRRERIDKPQPISVTISNAKVKMLDDGHARVNFIQSYRSGSLKATTRKALEMIRSNGGWQILSEQSGI